MIKKEWHWMPDYKQKQMSIIKEKKLSNIDVWNVVKEWYCNGMYANILQDWQGNDLEEICDHQIEIINNKN